MEHETIGTGGACAGGEAPASFVASAGHARAEGDIDISDEEAVAIFDFFFPEGERTSLQ